MSSAPHPVAYNTDNKRLLKWHTIDSNRVALPVCPMCKTPPPALSFAKDRLIPRLRLPSD